MILYYTETGVQGDVADVLEAIESGVNSRGGIAGRPLSLETCKDNLDVNAASACVQEAVDAGALAIIGNSMTCGSQFSDIIQQAEIASVSDQLFCPELFANPNVFPFNAGFFSNVAGSALGVEFFDQPNILVATLDCPACHAFAELFGSVAGPAGGVVTETVFIPLTATDLSSYAAQLAAAEGVLSDGNTVEISARLAAELDQQGFDQPIIRNPTTFDAYVFGEMFDNPTNSYIGSGFDLDSEGFQMFDADLTTFSSRMERNGVFQAIWLGVNVIANIAPELSELTPAAVLEHFQTSTSIDTFGMTPEPLDFTVKSDALGGTIPQVSNEMVALYKYENGALVRQTDFVDMLP